MSLTASVSPQTFSGNPLTSRTVCYNFWRPATKLVLTRASFKIYSAQCQQPFPFLVDYGPPHSTPAFKCSKKVFRKEWSISFSLLRLVPPPTVTLKRRSNVKNTELFPLSLSLPGVTENPNNYSNLYLFFFFPFIFTNGTTSPNASNLLPLIN